MNDFKLSIDLVPSTVWFQSLYRYYQDQGKAELWKKIKNGIFSKEGRKCWICNDSSGRLDAHEFWNYDDGEYTQSLVAIHHLCDLCHKIKHIGFWCHTPKGKNILEKSGLSREDLVQHFCIVNNCSNEDFNKHEKQAFKIHSERSKHQWKQDLGDYKPT